MLCVQFCVWNILFLFQEAIQPIGKFIPPDDVALPSSSGADLNNVDLWCCDQLQA